MAGDLATTSKRFPFCVEVKRREAWSMANLVNGKPSPVWKWWLQACGAALMSGKLPMLWLRENRGLWWVLLPAWKVDEAVPVRPSDYGVRVWPRGLALVDSLEVRPARVPGDSLLLTDPGWWV